ncbi:MAG TPA: ParA family protein [Bacilli bacterium]|nr:ParA family protein [Bacilli bacterium]
MGRIIKRYVLWNNKGGVGKSTLSFHLGSLYAETHPNEKVIILDLCPQANSTMMYLGGGTKGENNLINLQQQTNPRTLVGFISHQLTQIGATQITPVNASQFLHQASQYNPQIPDNVFLIPGDGNLEIVLSPMAYYANPQAMYNTWRNVLLWARDLCDLVAQQLDGEIVIFIDTNPSFALYTQQAIVAADSIIVPFNADDSSRTGVGALFGLIYGLNVPHPVYQNYTFAQLAKNANLPLPQIHQFVGNRFTQFSGTARAFAGLATEIQGTAWNAYNIDPTKFTSRTSSITSASDFTSNYCVDLRDFNSAGVVATNYGIPLSKLASGHYYIYGTRTQVNPDQVSACNTALNNVVKVL